MTRFDLTKATRDLLNTMVQHNVIDACGAMELGAECSTPEELIEGIVDIIDSRRHDRGFVQRRELISLADLAACAEKAQRANGF